MAHVFRDRYLTNVVSGTIGDADETAPAVSDTSRVAVTTNVAAQNHQWVPNTTATNTNTAPGAPSSASANGWRTVVGEYLAHCSDATVNTRDEAITIAAGTWPVRIRYIRDNQTLSGNPSGTVTVIIYRVNTAGTSQEEIGRATSASLSFTTTVQTATINVTGGSVSCAEGDRIQVDLYGVFAVYANVGTANCAVRVDSEANSGSKFDAPNFDISYADIDSDNQNPTDSRALSRNQAESDSAGSIDTVSKNRTQAESDNQPMADARALSQQKAVSRTLNLSDSKIFSRTSAPTDNAHPSDSHLFRQSKTRSDDTGLTDPVRKTDSKSRTDSGGSTDSKSLSQQRSTQNPVNTTDYLSKTQNKVPSDILPLTDSRNLGRGFQRTSNLGIGSSIFVGPFESIHVVGGEGGGEPGGRTFKLDISEGLSFTDTPATDGGHELVDFDDQLQLYDSSQIIFSDDHKTFVLDVVDSVGMQDLPSFDGGRQSLSSTDFLWMNDSTSISYSEIDLNSTHYLSLADFMSGIDSITMSGGNRVVASDELGLADEGRLNRVGNVVSDRIRLRDRVAISVVYPEQVVSDKIRFRDAATIELIPPGDSDRSIGRYRRYAR